MDLQAAQTKGNRNLMNRVTVALCLMLTGGLLIGSLVAPSRAGVKANAFVSAPTPSNTR